MTIMWIIGGIFIMLSIIIFSGVLFTQNYISTPPFPDSDGNTLKGSIAEINQISINDYNQSVLIRGKNVNNPVILFLHSGPGISETGIMRNINSDLENYFTMVYWDQRGTGKSYSLLCDESLMTINQFILDTHFLTKYLQKRLNKKKIILMGHSWGAGLGVFTASKYPDDYLAVIGIGQPVNPKMSDKLSFEHTLKLAINENNTEAIREHKKIYGYWNFSGSRYTEGMMVQKKWVQFYGGQFFGKNDLSLMFKNMMSNESTIFDWIPLLLGTRFSINSMAASVSSVNLIKEVPKLEIPYFLIHGKNDINQYMTLTNDYFNHLDAPLKKAYWFDNSAHWPHIEESEKFRQIIKDYILPYLIDK